MAPVAAAASAPAAATAPAPAAPAGEGELQIRFAADTWYEIRDNSGKIVMGGTAKAGQTVAGGGTAPYKVVIGNVKGVESLTRNGTPVDLKAANRNNVARLTLP
ncbi:Cytoskeleton protein RodZ [compost metagenome]